MSYSLTNRSLTSSVYPYKVVLLLSCLSTTIAGCGGTSAEVPSNEVLTRSIWAGIDLESRGNGNTRVKVELNEGSSSGANVRLNLNERLDVNAEGIIVTLREDEDFGDIDYEGTVPTDVGGTLFRIYFYRADGTVESGSSVNIPAPYEITSPAPGQNFQLGGDIPLIWTTASIGNNIELEVNTVCPLATGSQRNSTQWFPIADTGTRNFDTSNLQVASANDLAPGGVCDLEVALRRERRGTLDSSFRGGGFVRAIQPRRVLNMTMTLP